MFPKLWSVQFLLLTALLMPARAQEADAKGAADGASAALPSTRTLARDYPVITVANACPRTAGKTVTKPGSDCKTVITREEFEELVNAVNPRMIKVERRQLAQNYGRMLALENEALREGIDKKPEMQALLRYVRASALGGGAYRQVLREAGENSEAEVEKFYQANQSSYERYTLQRLFIPMVKQQRQAKSLEEVSADDGRAASAEEMKALAGKMRVRAAAGEDFIALEKEIFQQSGLSGEPNVLMEDLMRGTLPKDHNQVFELSPGGVSALIVDANGYYVYKVISKKTPAFPTIREQVAIEMENKRTAAALKKIENVKVNDTYFEKYDPPAPNPNEPEVDDD